MAGVNAGGVMAVVRCDNACAGSCISRCDGGLLSESRRISIP